ncbi:MAG: helix-turn-helix domain-containing protein, partial [Microcoleus sp.]
MEILTLTFACNPTPEQAEQIDRWLDLSRGLWNFGLEKLKELDDRCVWSDFGREFVPRSRVIPSFEESAHLTEDLRAEGWGRVCPRTEWAQPMLEKMGVQSKGGLSLCGRSDLLPYSALAEIPSKFRMGLLAMLDTSWQEWRKSLGSGTKGEPKFKSKFRERDAVRVLYSGNLKKELKCAGEILKGVPILKDLSVPGLNRWRDDSGKIPAIAGF